MAHYHVLLGLSNEDAPRCVLTDLSEDQLRTRFVTPYRRGQDVLCGNEIVKVSQINKVTIIRTADTSANELSKIHEKSRQKTEEFNRTSRSMVIFSLGRGHNLEDIVEAGDDVTSSHILGPPGYGNTFSVVTAVVNHPCPRKKIICAEFGSSPIFDSPNARIERGGRAWRKLTCDR